MGHIQGCHGKGKVREIPFFVRVREKLVNFVAVREFCNLLSKSGKSQGISSVVPIDAYFSSFGK